MKPKRPEPEKLAQFLWRVTNLPLVFITIGLLLLGAGSWLLFGTSNQNRNAEKAMAQAEALAAALGDQVTLITDTLMTEAVQAKALEALADAGKIQAVKTLMEANLDGVHSVEVLGTDLLVIDPETLGQSGLIKLDMLLRILPTGQAWVQMLRQDDQDFLVAAATIGAPEAPDGYLVVLVEPSFVLQRFNVSLPAAGYVGIEHRVAGFKPYIIREVGQMPEGMMLEPLGVKGSMLRVVVPQSISVEFTTGTQNMLLFLIGSLMLAYGIIRRQFALRAKVKFQPDPESLVVAPLDADDPEEWSAQPAASPEPEASPFRGPAPGADEAEEGLDPYRSRAVEPDPVLEYNSGEIPLTDSYHDLMRRRRESQELGGTEPVELSKDIFRAYDIRGVVGESLDPGVAYQVGQAVGSLALERDASPVVVGRDGRHSGPALVQGLVEGLLSTGCDVIDVGAVPTGALYYAAYELGAGSGVMVTGSHNPPEYNGLKVVVGGHTLSNELITGLYDRIVAGDLAKGQGELKSEEVLQRYRSRIASDIQIQRPLKVVADCGNGIGGSCAIEILRAIGAEVLPLYDDVDGDFPNHHPDPSDPKNLEDLNNAVRIMNADLGVAFDGDADRLGVVTATGDIVFADRLMMLYAREILSRNPGARIIYDVKCTGHLDTVIAEAGGDPEMYKTGHSLIKNHMKTVDSPFAGEMSGHFFFKDRWYGFDCGIYAAARLLEILAMDPRNPLQVLNDLPNSVSTPELKVELEEGENHAFIERFQAEASFEGARVNTIDGLRADFPNGWGLVRASNTTPILVLRFDADTEADLRQVQEIFRAQLLAIKPDMTLPF